MAVIKTAVNSRIYIHILDHFLIPSTDNAFGDEDFVFKDDNTSCHRAKCVRDFLANRQIATMNWPANSPDLNPIENMRWKLKKTRPGEISTLQGRSDHCHSQMLKKINIDYYQSLVTSTLLKKRNENGSILTHFL